MSSHNPEEKALSGLECQRRWSTAEKLIIVQETNEPDVMVSIVARGHIQQNRRSIVEGSQLFATGILLIEHRLKQAAVMF